MIHATLSSITFREFELAGAALMLLNGLFGIINGTPIRRQRLKDAEAGGPEAKQDLKRAQSYLWNGYFSFVMGLAIFALVYFGP
jgi:hypothetical protein